MAAVNQMPVPRVERTSVQKVGWLWAGTLVTVCGLLLIAYWLFKPMPPPRLSVDLLGFRQIGTNWYATVAFTNRGPSFAYLDPVNRNLGWSAEFQTLSGGGKMYGLYFRDEYLGIAPNSSEIVSVPVSAEVIQWQVSAPFFHYKRHQAQRELRAWLINRHSTGTIATLVYDVGSSLMKVLPMPPIGQATINSGWLTNRPPVAPLP